MKRKIIGILLIAVGVGLWFVQRQHPDVNKGVLEDVENKVSVSEEVREESGKEPEEIPKEKRDLPEKAREVAELREINPDVKGIIEVPGTEISAPVLQGKDNEFYLRRDIHKNYDINGSIFLDYESSFEPMTDHMVIYGHNMKNRTMFSDVALFKDPEFFNSHRELMIHTEEGTYRFEIFAGYIIDLQNEDAFIPFNEYITWGEEMDAVRYKEALRPLAVVFRDLEIRPEDKIISLSTCTYEHDNARFILVGVKKQA